MSNVPSAFETVILVAAVYRVFRLIAFDTITDGVRARLFKGDRLPGLQLFIECPWCAGFWLTLLVWGSWIVWPHATMVAAVPWAIALGVGLIPKSLDP